MWVLSQNPLQICVASCLAEKSIFYDGFPWRTVDHSIPKEIRKSTLTRILPKPCHTHTPNTIISRVSTHITHPQTPHTNTIVQAHEYTHTHTHNAADCHHGITHTHSIVHTTPARRTEDKSTPGHNSEVSVVVVDVVVWF